MSVLQIRIDGELLAKAHKAAEIKGITVSAAVREFLETWSEAGVVKSEYGVGKAPKSVKLPGQIGTLGGIKIDTTENVGEGIIRHYGSPTHAPSCTCYICKPPKDSK